MIRFVRMLALSLVAVAFAAPAIADDTITVNWTNSTGRSIALTSYSCTPSSACTLASIGIGETKALTNTATPTTGTRSITAKYRYWDATGGPGGVGTWKSCQVQASAEGPSTTWPGPGCQPGSFSYSFTRTDGSATSPKCTGGAVTVDYPTCTFTYNVNMAH